MNWLQLLAYLATLIVALGTIGALLTMVDRTLGSASPILVLVLTAGFVALAAIAGTRWAGGLSTAYW
jgi:NAD/NADP transhydrogenase alpha subunit